VFHVGLGCTQAVEGENGPEHPDSGFTDAASATQRLTKLVEQAEEDMLPRIPRQQPIDDSPPCREDLHRNVHHRVPKRGEVHPQQLPFFVPMFSPASGHSPATPTPSMPSGSRPTNPSPCTPIAQQVVHRRRQRSHVALELCKEILLVTTAIGLEDDLLDRLLQSLVM